MPLKFLIFDAIVVATLIVGACHLLDHAGLTVHRSLPYADERGGSLDVVHGAECGDAGDGENQQPLCDDEPLGNQRALSKGDQAELFGAQSVLSVPVWVETVSISNKDGSITYGLVNGISGQAIQDVDEKFVHAYEVYPPGTHAMCNIVLVLKNLPT
ncbi:hypothetical protein THAOC_09377 [Thalassiosira oceanica]|uniref:Uncharacterized protein n=1 Tax=Thalassiosira oceanica TaxID=159749 RepID=K0TFS3_THAOC|nr:hypothetical protein THAOC_09377 [Thalassiosira oceanica]|eukprot:EJK69377.1 hypothetical protein THAOC_09377 [Thalassiosira oceanica]